jgi:hypothetical protein
MKKEKKVTFKKTYLIELIHYDNKTYDIHRKNDGFNALELIGIMEHAKQEIYLTMAGEIKPTIIKRSVSQ